ncbi:hypothetical protein PGT21_017553 [Puccinia graminis f. sp. tritici]|nr:hypothetical protein PGTUg99_001187 [Puccinia graminis f. sp. tritici]KAA1094315.1 hypothetical protein PGT21_017553 [Puccinia graminis f. sp. tritici]
MTPGTRAYYVCLRNHAYPSSGSYPGPGLGVQTTNVQPIHHSTTPLIDFAQSIIPVKRPLLSSETKQETPTSSSPSLIVIVKR